MTQMLKPSDRKFKITVIQTLKLLMAKVNNIQGQVGNFSRDGNLKK